MPTIKLKTERLTLRVTPNEKRRLEKLIRKLQMDASAIIRAALRTYAEFHEVK